MNTMQNLETEEQSMKSQKVYHFKDTKTNFEFEIVLNNSLSDSYIVFYQAGEIIRIPFLKLLDENVK